jgi:hypothetical protein
MLSLTDEQKKKLVLISKTSHESAVNGLVYVGKIVQPSQWGACHNGHLNCVVM